MFIRIIELVLIALGLIAVEPIPHHATDTFIRLHERSMAQLDELEWAEFHGDAYDEYADEFTALFNSYETKWSKNNRLMIRNGDSGPFRFAKRSA